jgi:alanine racemase
MSLVLSVRTATWCDHVRATVANYGGADRVVAVVKGNGYGFGPATLLDRYRELVDAELAGPFGIAVGTVHEAVELAGTVERCHVLTPAMGPLPENLPPGTVMTVGDPHHVAHLARHGWEGPVVVKLASSMRRYGVDPEELHALIRGIHAARCEVIGAALHLGLEGDDATRRHEIESWLRHLDMHWPLAVSHLGPETFTDLTEVHSQRSWWIRLGTSLWHGDKSMLHLGAEVVQIRRIHRGDTAGYRATASPATGHLLAIGAGSAQGVQIRPDGASPVHFARRRLALLEAPHMHTTMAVVPDGDPTPQVGDVVDIQCPLTQVAPDEVIWLAASSNVPASPQHRPR